MGEMKWDAKALLRSTATLDLQAAGLSKEPDTITFYEFSKTDFVDFVKDCITGAFIDRDDTDDVKKGFAELAIEQSVILDKYLSKATKGERTSDFFSALEVSARGYCELMVLIYELNHVGDILTTGGNWIAFPALKAMFAQNNSGETETL